MIKADTIAQKIFIIRGEKVMLDVDLATLYGVETKTLNRAVKRHRDRFPEDFMFQLKYQEVTNLRCQIGTSSLWGGRRYLSYAFTEEGVAMLSGVLNSPRAVRVNIEIMRAFVRMRGFLSHHKKLTQKLDQLEKKVTSHDVHIRSLFEALRQLMAPPRKDKDRIGF